MADNTKSFWKSRTLWLAVLQIIVGILTAVNNELLVGSTITLLGFVQIVLRAVTTTPIKFE